MASGDIIALADAKDFLNITSTVDDAKLGEFISAASQMWINRCGPVASSAFDEWYDGGGTQISLRHTPVLAITKVEESFTAATLYPLVEQTLLPGGDSGAWGYSVDLTTGTVTRRAAGVVVNFQPGLRNIHVVYTAGFGAIPADIVHAVKLLVKHMWATQRGGGQRPGTGGDMPDPANFYMWPQRVQEIANYYSTPGIA
jgi:hypothetical protein